MDLLINAGLPLSLGIRRQVADFRRILSRRYLFAIGDNLRDLAPDIAERIDAHLSKFTTALFALIALAANRQLFVDNLGVIGAGLISLNIALLLIGPGVARAARLTWNEGKFI